MYDRVEFCMEVWSRSDAEWVCGTARDYDIMHRIGQALSLGFLQIHLGLIEGGPWKRELGEWSDVTRLCYEYRGWVRGRRPLVASGPRGR